MKDTIAGLRAKSAKLREAISAIETAVRTAFSKTLNVKVGDFDWRLSNEVVEIVGGLEKRYYNAVGEWRTPGVYGVGTAIQIGLTNSLRGEGADETGVVIVDNKCDWTVTVEAPSNLKGIVTEVVDGIGGKCVPLRRLADRMTDALDSDLVPVFEALAVRDWKLTENGTLTSPEGIPALAAATPPVVDPAKPRDGRHIHRIGMLEAIARIKRGEDIKTVLDLLFGESDKPSVDGEGSKVPKGTEDTEMRDARKTVDEAVKSITGGKEAESVADEVLEAIDAYKFTKEQVNFRKGNKTRACGNCAQFIYTDYSSGLDANECRSVKGCDIGPGDLCDLWAKLDARTDAVV